VLFSGSVPIGVFPGIPRELVIFAVGTRARTRPGGRTGAGAGDGLAAAAAGAAAAASDGPSPASAVLPREIGGSGQYF